MILRNDQFKNLVYGIAALALGINIYVLGNELSHCV